MIDAGAVYTDKELAKLEKKIKSVYKEAAKDIEQKMQDFTAKSQAKEQKNLQKVAKGEMTQEEFDKWKAGQVFQGKQWAAKKEEIANVLYNANTAASDILNKGQFNIFAANANYASYQMEQEAGVNFGFSLYDQNTVIRLIKDEPNLLPNYKPKKSKDIAWNKKKITRQITQGIIQGESLNKIAKRLATVTASQNMNSMKTHARTLMTGAQNAGRLDSYNKAQKMGIEIEKEWMATLDGHTRDSHRNVDGETVPIDKPFSNGLMYPGDPDGNPHEVYNCFIPETNIASDSEIIRSYKHYYSGKIVSIKSARGINFSCTPNHPILTDRGWIAARSLNNGDHLIVTSGVNNEVSRRNPNINHAFPRIDTIHELFYIMGGKRTCTLGVNFHGDIPTSNVEIITQKRFLRGNFNICIRKCINKFLLKFTDTTLMCESSFMKHFRGIVRSSFSNIGSISKPFSLIGGGLCHSNIHRFRSVPNVNIRLSEYSINNLPADSNFFGESLIGLTGKIFLDDIISVDVSDFTGHVYNLQTKNNYYFVNNNTNNTKSYNDIFAIAHNCRCTMVSDIKKYPSIYNRYDNQARSRIQNMPYNDWKDAKKAGKSMAPYSIDKIKIGNLFEGLSQNGAYSKIHDVDVTLSNQFYKELQEMGQAAGGLKPSATWQAYLNGELPEGVSATKLENLMSQYVDKATTVQAPSPATVLQTAKEIKSAKIKSLEDAQTAMKAAQDAIQKAGADKEFTGIWKDPVTYKDYEAKAGSIQAKKDYYNDQIEKYAHEIKLGNGVLWHEDQIAKLKENLKQLEEFEKNGAKYAQLYKNLEIAQAKVKEFTPLTVTGKGFATDAYDPKVKAASKAFSSGKDADKFYRPELDKQWKNMPDKEKYAVWEYTHNSNPMNKPLSGYEETWSRSGFVGLDKANWGHEDKYRSLGSNFKKFGTDGHVDYKETITNLTKAIDKAEIKADVNLVRGSDKSGFAGLLEGNLFSYKDAEALLQKDEKTIKAALEGQVFQNHAFTSTGIAKGTGFNGEVKYEIYAPKGTKGIYAEPQSYFGNTISGEELYKPGQSYSSIGGEAEVILQRGTEYRITEVTKNGYQLTVKMEVVGQPDYFKYGDEDTFNAGLTRHKK